MWHERQTKSDPGAVRDWVVVKFSIQNLSQFRALVYDVKLTTRPSSNREKPLPSMLTVNLSPRYDVKC